MTEAEKNLLLPVESGDVKGDLIFVMSKQEVNKYMPKPANRLLPSGQTVTWITRTVGPRKTKVGQRYLEAVDGKDSAFVEDYCDLRKFMIFPEKSKNFFIFSTISCAFFDILLYYM